jgi:BirA family biotin operon repressor/biotin-[acetyl-CoA-carboxylase] ligase
MQLSEGENWEGRRVSEWRRLWKAPILQIFHTLDSTNDLLKALATGGAGTWTTVVAEAQTRGRGRGGKAWDSPAAMGLWVSLLLPSEGPDADALLPIRVGLSVARTVDRAGPGNRDGGEGVLLKWPNDLLLAGRKVGGILCEALGANGVCVGLGLNVRQRREDFPASLRDTAISLEGAWQRSIPRGDLLGKIIRDLRQVCARTTDRLRPEELDAYADRDALLGRPVRSELEGRGVGAGITSRGFLMIENTQGDRREIRGGSV